MSNLLTTVIETQENFLDFLKLITEDNIINENEDFRLIRRLMKEYDNDQSKMSSFLDDLIQLDSERQRDRDQWKGDIDINSAANNLNYYKIQKGRVEEKCLQILKQIYQKRKMMND